MPSFKATHVAHHNLASAIAETEVWADAHSGYLDEKDPDHRMTHFRHLINTFEDYDGRDAPEAYDAALELAAFALHYLAMKKHMNVPDPSEAPRASEGDRPDFAGFAASLREEAKWSAHLHSNDKTGQAASDQFRLNTLATSVEYLGWHLGFMSSPTKEGGRQ